MKKLMALALVMILVLPLAACGGNNDTPNGGTTPAPSTSVGTSDGANAPTDTPQTNMGDGTGTYEGETDDSGLFSGWGVWVYHNCRYEGYFENGLPNGMGTLYKTLENWNNTFTGQWVDGYAEGELAWHIYYTSSDYGFKGNKSFTFNFPVTKGQASANVAAAEDSEYIMEITPENDIFAVPPFADEVLTDTSLAPPDGNGQPSGETTSDSGDDTPAQSTPANTTPDKSDWVGTYTSDFATISIFFENETLVADIIKDGNVVIGDFLNIGRLVEPGGPLPAMGQHDDPWKSISEMMLLELSEDYQTLTLSVLDIPGGSGSWDYVTDDFLGEYARQ